MQKLRNLSVKFSEWSLQKSNMKSLGKLLEDLLNWCGKHMWISEYVQVMSDFCHICYVSNDKFADKKVNIGRSRGELG